MAKISTYPLEGNPKLSDKLIGTSVGLNQIGNLENPTYNFSLQQLLDLFSPLLPGNTLQGVLDNNNTATQDINLFGTITTEDLEVTNIANIFSAYISDSLYIEGELFDKNNSQGTVGQILTSTGDGIEWITPSNVIPTLQEVLTSGNIADLDMNLSANIFAEDIDSNNLSAQDSFQLYGSFIDSNGSSGSLGQMLISLGNSVQWQDVPVYTASSPLSINSITRNITIQQANGTQNGYLSYADWINFDGKQNALSGTGIVVSDGGTITYITNNSYDWNRAFNDNIVSVSVTGLSTKTITLTQRDGDTLVANWNDDGGGGGGIASVGLIMPAAFNVLNSPLTADGDIEVEAAGDANQYIKGDGTLGTFPTIGNYVPYTGATQDVDLGSNDLTANSIIKNGGTSSQFLKADGSIDSSSYITLASLLATSPLIYNELTGTFSIQQSNSTQGGYLSSNDWNTFNGKQDSGNYITDLTGEATASGPGAASVVLNNAAVIAKVLTGLNITGGSVVSTDNILEAFGKLQNQINALISGSAYQGVWNADTNTPALASGVGSNGEYYVVNVAGSTNLDGITDWNVGDWAIFHDTSWQKVDNTDSVSSVNGQVGAVNLTTDNIPEGLTNLYYLDSRTRLALSFASGSGAYNNTTGVITIPTNNNQIINGAGYITNADLSQYLLISTAASTYYPIPTGTTAQYLRGDGSLATFPTIPTVTPSALTKVDDTNVTLTLGGTPNSALLQAVSLTLGWTGTLADSRIASASVWNAKQDAITLTTLGTSGAATFVSNVLNIPDYSAVIGGYVPYTGATQDVDLGTHTLLAADLVINHSSGSGAAASITKNGSGEALTVVKGSGSGNAASITGGVTLISELHLTTDLADAYIASASVWNAKFTLPTLTSGSVLFSNGTTIAQDNANLFWDNTNNRLVIGFNTPINNSRLLVVGDDYQITLASTNGLTGIFCSDQSVPMISLDSNANLWNAFNNTIQYNVSDKYFNLKKIIISDLGQSTILGAEKMPNGASFTTASEETLIGVYDNTTTYWETGIYAKRNIYCGAYDTTTILTIAPPNSSVDLVAKIGYGSRFFIAKVSVMVDWNALNYTYKITSTNTTRDDDSDSLNINFEFAFSGAEFVVQINNNSGNDIYPNINANIL